MHGRIASELVKEFASSEPGQLGTFNCLKNVMGISFTFGFLMRKIQEHENKLKDKRRSEDETGISEDERRKTEAEKMLIQSALKSDQFGAQVHHLSLVRSKRCLMAYVYNRAKVIRSLGWMVDRVLPEEIQEKLSSTEEEYFKNHVETLQSYMSELDIQLNVVINFPCRAVAHSGSNGRAHRLINVTVTTPWLDEESNRSEGNYGSYYYG